MSQQLYGGYIQRLAQAKALEEQEQQPSKLAAELLQKWAWGTMSAPAVQSLAAAALADGLDHPEVQRLASIGASGKFPGNMHRDLLQVVSNPVGLQEMTSTFPIKLTVNKKAVRDSLLTFILPHKLFACLFHSLPKAFETCILGGDKSNAGKFWKAMKHHPFVEARPELQKAPNLGKLIPLAIHGDGVSYMQTRQAGGKSMDVLSWTSLLAKGPTKVSSFLMFAVVKAVVKEKGVFNTWGRVWKIICWSLQALAVGVWPLKSWDDTDFEEGTIDFEKRGSPSG